MHVFQNISYYGELILPLLGRQEGRKERRERKSSCPAAYNLVVKTRADMLKTEKFFHDNESAMAI